MSNQPNYDHDSVPLALVHMLSNRLSHSFEQLVQARTDISVIEWRVMIDLGRYKQTTAAEIASRWAMDKMNVSRAIRRLESRGWIERHIDEVDRRSYRLILTAEGRSNYQTLMPAAESRYREITSILTRDELASFTEMLSRLIENIDELER
jgi:DNA-binding MarR family transcriptional regulator